MKRAVLAVCVLLLPAWLVNLRWAWYWSNHTDREIGLRDGTVKLDFFHSGPTELIAQWLDGRPFGDCVLVTPWWYEISPLTWQFWFPTFRQEWGFVASLDPAGRVTAWHALPPSINSPNLTGRRATFRWTRYQIPLWPLALPALPALWVLSRDTLRACRKARRRRRGLCLRCGYDLTGNVSGRCPECGTACGLRAIDAPSPPV